MGAGGGGGRGAGRVEDERGVGEKDLAGLDGAGGDESAPAVRELGQLHERFDGGRRHGLGGCLAAPCRLCCPATADGEFGRGRSLDGV